MERLDDVKKSEKKKDDGKKLQQKKEKKKDDKRNRTRKTMKDMQGREEIWKDKPEIFEKWLTLRALLNEP